MVTPPAPQGPARASRGDDALLAAALDRLTTVHHAALRHALVALAAHRDHLTGEHGPALAAITERIEAVVGANLAREVRVIVPYLRALAAGTPDYAVFPSIAAPWPVVTSEQRACREATDDLIATLMTMIACPTCAVVVTHAHDLACALAAHRGFTDRTLYPLARARERRLARPPPT